MFGAYKLYHEHRIIILLEEQQSSPISMLGEVYLEFIVTRMIFEKSSNDFIFHINYVIYY